ncbi:ABC-F family ATP-binding cassette domain-containing protein [Amycolatopsis magusensis]|uniref:ABC-F family ATP-binding cassette domain-containing protein n=1 Tax=Amycolatopsis magusensis TaxID=882444 RepID=UPI0024A97A54|nr:ABC-F family ATP-binding cassette domain-containing protein [Amycolatopsis magusensis]MDI5977254.1 ABC-F family ATP-binding cassette domain-containing protein [Amycolatopsis magusensis]
MSRTRKSAHLQAERLGKSFAAQPVLEDVSLVVGAGQCLGVVGENGSGKTTLLHLLAGALPPDTGTVSRHGSVAMAGQELPFTEHDTVATLLDVALAGARAALAELDAASAALAEQAPGADDRFAALTHAEELDAWDAERRADLALAGLGATTDRTRRLAELSVGQRYRVRLACLLAEGVDILLLDEPTNHLDAAALGYLTGRIRAHPGAVVLVSHDRMLLDEVCGSLLDLDPTADGGPKVHGGGYTEYKREKAAERVRWEQRYALESGEAERLEHDATAAANRLISSWRPDKGVNKHKRATRAPGQLHNVQRRIDALAERRVPPPPERLSFACPDLSGTGQGVVLTASGVAVPGRLAPAAPIALSTGDRLLVSGANGAGKSTLLNVLAGRLEPAAGSVWLAGSARVGLLAQESDFPDTTVGAAALYERRAAKLVSRGQLSANAVVPLKRLGLFSAADADRPVNRLSTGQRRRLALALLLLHAPHVLLLDEPTNHLSVTLVDELTEAIRRTPVAVVVASHDRQLRADLAEWPSLELSA